LSESNAVLHILEVVLFFGLLASVTGGILIAIKFALSFIGRNGNS
jgi:hypothetical protein